MAPNIPAALVTGANKGIGLQVVRELCRRFKGTVYLTARDKARGEKAVATLTSEGLHPEFLQMDVTDSQTVDNVQKYIQTEHGGLDILVNNAGVMVRPKNDEEFVKEAPSTLAINYFGVLNVCDRFFPLLRPHARVVNVSSTLGSLRLVKDKIIKSRLIADDLTVEELNRIVKDFLSAVQNGKTREMGFPGNGPYGSYSFSKLAVTALTRVQQRNLDVQFPGKDIVINAVHPGYVATDMTEHKGPLTVEQGADSLVYLVLLPSEKEAGDKLPRGELISERKIVNWRAA